MAEQQRKKSKGLFDPDSPLMSGLGRLTRILVISFLWTITSLPIFTIGASSSAVYYVMLKLQRNEEGHCLQDYFRAFRNNFGQATVIWLLLLTIGCIFGFSAYYYGIWETGPSDWIVLLFGALLFFLFVVLIYVFPLISRFAYPFRNIILLSCLLPIKNLKWTFALVLLAAVVLLICIYITPLIFFGYGLYAFASSYIFAKIFKPMEALIEEHNQQKNEI